MLGVARAEARAVLEPERRDPLRPRVELLEEVQRRAAVALAEGELVRADVEHGRLRGRLELVEEQPELAPAGAEGHGIGEAHARKYRLRLGSSRVRFAWSRPASSRRGSTRFGSRRGRTRGAAPSGRALGGGAAAPGRLGRRSASCERAVDEARFVLALDDDTSEFHRRFARDPLLGPSVRTLRGLRPRRTATVAQAALRAVCGQLVQSRAARDLERAIIRACGEDPPSREALARLSPAELCRCGLATSRAATLDADRPDDRSRGTARGRTERRARAPARAARVRAVEPRRGRAPGARALRPRARRAISGWSSSGRPSAAAGPSARTRPPSCSRRTASGRGSRACSCSPASRAGSCRARAPTARGSSARAPARGMSGVAPDGSPVALYAQAARARRAGADPRRRPSRARRSSSSAPAPAVSRIRLLALGHPVVAVDNSEEMLALIDGAETVLADIETLDLARRFPVVVLASNFINHPDDAERRGVPGLLRPSRPARRPGPAAGIPARLDAEHAVGAAR